MGFLTTNADTLESNEEFPAPPGVAGEQTRHSAGLLEIHRRWRAGINFRLQVRGHFGEELNHSVWNFVAFPFSAA
jgi:hypothetical protein